MGPVFLTADFNLFHHVLTERLGEEYFRAKRENSTNIDQGIKPAIVV